MCYCWFLFLWLLASAYMLRGSYVGCIYIYNCSVFFLDDPLIIMYYPSLSLNIYYLFIYLVARSYLQYAGSSVVACKQLWHAGSSFLNQTQAPCIGSTILATGPPSNYFSLSLVIVFILMSIMSDMSISIPAFTWFQFSWNIIFHLLTFNLYVSLGLRWVSCGCIFRGLFFFFFYIHSDNLCLWLEHLAIYF